MIEQVIEAESDQADNLEDLLIYDDLFLDYFNAFLSLPAFPQTLQYHRLTGTFQITDDPDDSLVEYTHSEPLYGATDEEREKIMEWAREERMPLFLKTELFRELKLCRLLLRPIDQQKIGSRPGTYIRGYSRQSPDSETLTDSAGTSDYDSDLGESDEGQLTDVDASSNIDRPSSYAECSSEKNNSRTYSLPGIIKIAKSEKSAEAPDSVMNDRNNRNYNSDDFSVSPYSYLKRVYSAPTFGITKNSKQSQFEFDMTYFTRTKKSFVAFGTKGESAVDVDMKSVEDRQNIVFDRLKEIMLGSRNGMTDFLTFLSSTVGIHLIDFWLDCEYYKDTFSDRTDADNAYTRNRLFRDLQDKYKMRLTEEAKAQIRLAANDPLQANSIFLRTQYDVLRRLRSYWLPRYILHKERQLSHQTFSDLQQAWLTQQQRRTSTYSTALFPSLSLATSMPVRPDIACDLAQTAGWNFVRNGGRKQDERIYSARVTTNRSGMVSSKTVTGQKPLNLRLRDAMMVDKIAGGPFQNFLERYNETSLLNCLLFFQEVEDYSKRDERSSDRFLRLGHAWNIFNVYINVDAKKPIHTEKSQEEKILAVLRKSRDSVPSKIFETIQNGLVNKMNDIWLKFLKDDVKKFLESSNTHRDSNSPPHSSDEIQIFIENGKIIVKRIQSEKTQASMPIQRRSSWDLLTKQEKVERKRLMEIERQKALKAVKKRLKEESLSKKNNLKRLNSEDDEESFEPEPGPELTHTTEATTVSEETAKEDSEPKTANRKIEEEVEVEKPPELKEAIKNKAVLQLFKKYVSDKEGKDGANLFEFYQQIIGFMELPGGEKGRKKRDAMATSLVKQFLEKGAKRRVEIRNDKVQQRLAYEKDRPKTATFKEVNQHLYQRLNLLFGQFWQHQAEEMGIDIKSLKNMTEAELKMRANVGSLGPPVVKKGKKSNGLSKSMPNSNTLFDSDFTDYQMRDRYAPRGKKTYDCNNLDKYLKHPISNLLKDYVQRDGSPKHDKKEKKKFDFNKRGIKATGRATPTKEDKVEFLVALEQNLSGSLSLQMLYFYKYLVQFSQEDKNPNLDKNLFFYVEAQRYKEFALGGCEDDFLKKKILAISSIFLESVFAPSLQISIGNDMYQRVLRHVQKYSNPKYKDDPNPNMFDECQFAVFKELLPYWAGFQKQWIPSGKEYRPISQNQKMLQRRLDIYNNQAKPNVNLKLPALPKSTVGVSAISLSLQDGLKWKEDEDRLRRKGAH